MPNTMCAFSHPDCYARDLGDCSQKLSREHYVSDAILQIVSLGKPSVLVRNLTFQQTDTQQEIGIGSLVAKVLCDKHNSTQSNFDAAGLALVSGMNRIDSAAGKSGQPQEMYRLKGDHLERWMLKTLCGGLFSGNIPVRGGHLKGVCPPREWLDILFRSGVLHEGQGLFVRAGSGEAFCTEPSILKMEVVQDSNDVVIGFRVFVFTFEFNLVLATLPTELPPELRGAIYRPNGIAVIGSSKALEFGWDGNASGQALAVQWLGNE